MRRGLKWILLSLTLAMLLAITACAEEQTDGNPESGAAGEALNDYSITDEEAQALAEILRKHVEENWTKEEAFEDIMASEKAEAESLAESILKPYLECVVSQEKPINELQAQVEEMSEYKYEQNIAAAIIVNAIVEWQEEQQLPADRYQNFWEALRTSTEERSGDFLSELLLPMVDRTPVIYEDENFTITFDHVEAYDMGGENSFELYFAIENRSGSDAVATYTELILNGRSFKYGYNTINAPAGETATGYFGFADHDYRGGEYDVWLDDVAENGLRTFTISITVSDAQGNVLATVTSDEIQL